MKHYIRSILLACFALPFLLQAQQAYLVKVGTFLDAKRKDFAALQPLGFVHADKLDDRHYTVFVGEYTSQAKADAVAAQVRNKGYANATVVTHQPSGRQVVVIQIASLDAKDPVNWERFLPAGELYLNLQDDLLRLGVGLFSGVGEARERLPQMKAAGFQDAFIKKVDLAFVHKVTSFELGDVKRELIPLAFNEQTKPAGDTDSQSPPGTSVKSVSPEPAAVSPPDIRSDIRRSSVIGLQTVLKAEGNYTASIDGYYGHGTDQAYQQFMAKNPYMQRYRILAGNLDFSIETGLDGAIQQAIYTLNTDPTAFQTLQGSDAPVAYGYLAYQLFVAQGPSMQVNNYMNEAIRRAYSGRSSNNELPFDPNSAYAYPNLDQLLLHLSYIHSAQGNRYAMPCWLFERHPEEMARAQAAFTDYASDDFMVQACDPFVQWEEVRMMLAVADDLGGRPVLQNQEQLRFNASRRAKLYLIDKPVTEKELMESVQTWDKELMTNLDAWANRDPLHKDLMLAFKTTYYQSQVRLEDFYMNKGYPQNQANILALATLHTLVSYQLERFV
jgi:hypothetical protein